MEKNQIWVIGIVTILAVAAAGAGIYFLSNDDDRSAGEIFVDARGREVFVEGDINRIFCQDCCSLEMVSWFKSVDKVCALDKNDKIMPNKTYTQVHKTFFSGLKTVDASNAEAVIDLAPDVVISSTVSVEDLNNQQKTYGVPVFAINADLEFASEDWYGEVKLLGALLGEKNRADEIVNGVKGVISDLQKKSVTGVNGYACGMMFYGMGTFVKTTGDYLPFTYSGVDNVFPTNPAGNKQPYNTDIETVCSKSFDYIFIDGSNLNAVKTEMTGYYATTTLDDKNAVKNGDIYKTMVYKIWGTQFDNQLINCAFVAKTVNASGYEWTFGSMADRILEVFYGDRAITYAQLAALTPFGGCGKVVFVE